MKIQQHSLNSSLYTFEQVKSMYKNLSSEDLHGHWDWFINSNFTPVYDRELNFKGYRPVKGV